MLQRTPLDTIVNTHDAHIAVIRYFFMNPVAPSINDGWRNLVMIGRYLARHSDITHAGFIDKFEHHFNFHPDILIRVRIVVNTCAYLNNIIRRRIVCS